MRGRPKQLASPFSTGGGGARFEASVQALFVALMLTGGFAPCLPGRPIRKVKLQGRFDGFETDDFIVFLADEPGKEGPRLLAQVKHSVALTESGAAFGDVIQAAWRDFGNARVFKRGRDAIALVTGPLSKAELDGVRPLLERARHAESAAEFFRTTDLANFSSARQREKLRVIRLHLQRANGDEDPSDADVFAFLQHFHLLSYDLDFGSGSTLSLLHTLIGRATQSSPDEIWALLLNEVQLSGQSAGTLTCESVSAKLRGIFAKGTKRTIPSDYALSTAAEAHVIAPIIASTQDLMIASLVGSWNEALDTDRHVIEELSQRPFAEWIVDIRKHLDAADAPVSLKSGRWRVVDRSALWDACGARVFDEHLERLRACACTVLGDPDPKFHLPPDERYMAAAAGKRPKYSEQLRGGLAETLALLGTRPGALRHCSRGGPEATAARTVRQVLRGQTWVLWASLDALLPVLAEAEPDEFLNAVEEALTSEPCPFDALFGEENGGIWGASLLSGLLWALETLAWSAEHLGRVAICLADLAARDPRGQWVNRPSRSLSTILLPWYPQTCAPVKKRFAAVSSVLREFPDVGWKLVVDLLPGSHRTTSDNRKPEWRTSELGSWTAGVKKSEYWTQIKRLSALALEEARSDRRRLASLVEHADKLHPAVRDELLTHLDSAEVRGLPEAEKLGIWTELVNLVAKLHRRNDADRALTEEVVNRVSSLADALSPAAPELRYKRLFGNKDFDLFETKGFYEEQSLALERHRQQAVADIDSRGAGEAVLRFAGAVECPFKVGRVYGNIAVASEDARFLPSLINAQDEAMARFLAGYCWGRHQALGWPWVDGLTFSTWEPDQYGRFLALLPFSSETWRRLVAFPESHKVYWASCRVQYPRPAEDLLLAATELLAAGRPYSAISCLFHVVDEKLSPDVELVAKVLLAAVDTREPFNALTDYELLGLIRYLQEAADADSDALSAVEWAYLPLLEAKRDTWPKHLNKRLAQDPSYFCSVIRLVFRSKGARGQPKRPTEKQEQVAANAYRLLGLWKTPPGLQFDGGLNSDELNQWLSSVKEECLRTGHLEVAMSMFGRVLIHAPRDPTGLWIHRGAAAVLNARDASEIRDGFRTELFNSRGVHWVDPEGKPEKELAAKYKEQADAVEEAGFQRLATTLRELAASYERQARRIASGGFVGD